MDAPIQRNQAEGTTGEPRLSRPPSGGREWRGLRGCQWGRFEVEQVENGEALKRAASGDGVVASLVPRAGTAGSFRDIKRNAQARAVELIGEFGALEREPADHVGSEGESEAVRVKAVEGSAWRTPLLLAGGHRRAEQRERRRES